MGTVRRLAGRAGQGLRPTGRARAASLGAVMPASPQCAQWSWPLSGQAGQPQRSHWALLKRRRHCVLGERAVGHSWSSQGVKDRLTGGSGNLPVCLSQTGSLEADQEKAT